MLCTVRVRGPLALCCAALVGWCWPAMSTDAATLVVDPSQSVISLSGVMLTPAGMFPVESQLPGSLTTNLGGTIEADLDLPGFIRFSGGSLVMPLPHPGLLLPEPGPADFAGLVEGALPGVIAFGALRDLGFDISMGLEDIGPGGNFPVFDMDFEFTQGHLDAAAAGLFSGSFDVTGSVVGNNTLLPGNLSWFGPNRVLTIPIEAEMVFNLPSLGITLDLDAVGQIVAVGHVPEPTTLVLLGLGMVGFLAVVRRQTAQ